MRYLKKVFSIFLALVLSISMLSSYVMTLKADNNVINLNELEPFKGRTKEEVIQKYLEVLKEEYYFFWGDNNFNDYYSETPSCVAPYNGGKLKDEVHQAMTDMTNYYRWLLGVNPYQTVSSHHKSLQEFAVIENLYIKKVGNLSHHPTTDGKFEKPGDMSEEFWSSGATLNNIIAAGSVVTKSFLGEGYVIGGNPAKVIGSIENLKEKNQHRKLMTWGMSFDEKKEYLLQNKDLFVDKESMQNKWRLGCTEIMNSEY